MSLDKAIEHGQERREPYRDSRRFDLSCRNHGGGRRAYPCAWCENNRLRYRKVFSELVKINEAQLREPPP